MCYYCRNFIVLKAMRESSFRNVRFRESAVGESRYRQRSDVAPKPLGRKPFVNLGRPVSRTLPRKLRQCLGFVGT